MWCRAISGDGGSGTTGAAVSGADARLGRRCRYSVPETNLTDSHSQSIRTLSLLDLRDQRRGRAKPPARERAAPPHTVDNEGGDDDTASDPDRLHALGPQRLGAAVQASDVRDLRGLCCRWPLSSRYDGANVAGYFLAMPAWRRLTAPPIQPVGAVKGADPATGSRVRTLGAGGALRT